MCYNQKSYTNHWRNIEVEMIPPFYVTQKGTIGL